MTLSGYQKAIAFAGLTTAPVTAQAGIANVSAAVKVDTHMKEGQSDARGDEKYATIVARTDNDIVIGVETGIVTPQFGRHRASRDTGSFIVTLGREHKFGDTDVGVYASAGLVNGLVLDKWHDYVNARHHGRARTSKASSGTLPVVGASARIVEDRTVAEIGGAKLDLDAAFFATARTDKIALGTGLFVSLNGGKNADFRPNLPNMPLEHQKSDYSVYAGLTASVRPYDLPTHRLGTNFTKLTAVAGAAVHMGRVAVGAEYQKDLTPELRHMSRTPIGRAMATVSFDF